MTKYNKENSFKPKEVQVDFKLTIHPPRDLVGGNEVKVDKKKTEKAEESYISLAFKFSLEKEIIENLELFSSDA